MPRLGVSPLPFGKEVTGPAVESWPPSWNSGAVGGTTGIPHSLL